MKEIKAYVRPFKVDAIMQSLLEAGFVNLSVSLSEGTGSFDEKGAAVETYFELADNKVAKIEIVCIDLNVEKIIKIISLKGKTGNPGDGIIYVSDVQRAIHIRTGEETKL